MKNPLVFIIGVSAFIIGLLLSLAVRQPRESSQAIVSGIVKAPTRAQKERLLDRLLATVGPAEAQELLFVSGLPFTGESHLLVHRIGEYIYETQGREGLQACREYFLSACYHAVIIAELAKNGMDGVARMMDSCLTNGPDVLIQCSHAAGHGFVAWKEYDLISALALCDSLSAIQKGFTTFNCYDGVFMENVYGVHGGGPHPNRWVRDGDVTYPCSDPRIGEQYRGACWSNQASLLFQRFGGDIRKVASVCDGVGPQTYREFCYHNLARQIHPMTEGNAQKTFALCGQMPAKQWETFCIQVVAASAYAVGDNKMPGELCGALTDDDRMTCLDMVRQQRKETKLPQQ